MNNNNNNNDTENLSILKKNNEHYETGRIHCNKNKAYLSHIFLFLSCYCHLWVFK